MLSCAHGFCLSVLLLLLFFLTENNRAPLQRSRSRQNMNSGGSAAVKAPPAKEAQNESLGHPSRAKAAACSESGRRYRNAPGLGHWLDRETARPPEKEKEVQAEAPAFRSSPAGAAVSGESDLEALLARLRALWGVHAASEDAERPPPWSRTLNLTKGIPLRQFCTHAENVVSKTTFWKTWVKVVALNSQTSSKIFKLAS